VRKVARYNGMSNPNLLRVGQVLKFPPLSQLGEVAMLSAE
jgi:nucleoid-associated protein YgaU